MSKIYLACPYSSKSYSERIYRANVANRIAGILISQGHIVFSPISHGHAIASTCDNIQTDHLAWRELNHKMIRWSEEVHIITLPGYDTSEGITDERDYASELTKPIILIHPDDV